MKNQTCWTTAENLRGALHSNFAHRVIKINEPHPGRDDGDRRVGCDLPVIAQVVGHDGKNPMNYRGSDAYTAEQALACLLSRKDILLYIYTHAPTYAAEIPAGIPWLAHV